MSIAEAERKAARIEQLTLELMYTRGDAGVDATDPMAFWAPGRIEVLGKHTDYGGGRSLLCAAERGICVVAHALGDNPPGGHKRGSSLVRMRDANSEATAEFELAPDVAAVPGHWSNYPITVARRIAANFSGPLRGADIVFASDIPHAAGVSSSSALVVATFLALSAANNLPETSEYRDNIRTSEDLAGYLGCVENGCDFKALRGHVGVGTFGGSEDQTAILCARANSLVQYSFCPVTFERSIALPASCTFVIAASGVLAEKTGAALKHYNRVSHRLSAGLECWRRATGRDDASMGAAIASSSDAHGRIRKVLRAVTDAEYSSESLLQRFEQFDVETNRLIPAAGDALANNDLAVFGELVAQSQLGAERGLENQIPETVALVHEARKLGAFAASAFGGGFGGSVWALVASSSVEDFRHAWATVYHEAFPQHTRHSEFFGTRAGPAAIRL